MNSFFSIILITTLVLQAGSPFSSGKAISPSQTISIEFASSELANIPNSAPNFSDQLKATSANEKIIPQVTIKLKASPQLIKPGEMMNLDWSIDSWKTIQERSDLSLVFDLPTGVIPETSVASIATKYGMVFTIPLTSEKGSLTFNISPNIELPFLIDVKLMAGKEQLNANSVLLDQAHYTAEIGKATTIIANGGKVRIDIPASAISENLLIDVRDPGPSNVRGYSLSGLPVEILAVGENTKTNISSFKDKYTLTVRYDPENIFGWTEDDLSLFYFDEDTLDWWPIPTTVNKTTHELTAKVDHLTVFDYKANSWQGARTPTVDGAQVSSYTGAGTYNMSFWTPPAPGGFQPGFSLNYNSQVIDNSTAFTQSSWVGMGWSLDTGYIERNMHSTNSDTDDDTFSLMLNGTSTQLLPIEVSGTITRYATRDINYYTIEFDSSTGNWTVWDQAGTHYHFDDQAKTDKENSCLTTLTGTTLITWRWSLSAATDKFGNTLIYSYYKQPKSGSCVNQVAVYPDTISYPNGKYQIKFIRETRTDYQSAWEASDSKTFYSNQRLDKILVQQNTGGSNWINIRQFDLSYSAGTTNQIYPPFTWTKGGKTTTLVGVQELSGDGASALPATTFSYADYMHLTQVNNSQGGKVTFDYERWQYLDDVNKDIRHIYTVFGTDECTPTIGTLWYTMSGGYGLVKCSANMLQIDRRTDSVGVGLREFPQHMVKPGGQYRMVINARNIYSVTSVLWGFTDPYNGPDIEGSMTGVGTAFVQQEFVGEMPVLFNPNATKLIIECDNCYVQKIDFALMQLYYRVTTQTVEDTVTGRTATYTYNYDEPTANDTIHSEVANKSTDMSKYYVPTMRDYRGNAMSMVKNPDGLLNTTWFYQNDILSGSPYRTLTSSQDLYDGFDVLSTTNWNYSHQTTRQDIRNKNGDGALMNTNPGADWTSVVNRASYTLDDGDVMVAQFYATGDNVQNELGITNSSGDFFGLVEKISGTQKVVQMRTSVGGTTTDSTTLISESAFKLDTWYMVMIFVDADDDFQIRVWEKINPQNYGESSSNTLNGNTTWRFRQKTYNGTVYLDTYLEGVPYSETETSYSTSVLYDTDTTTTTIPNIASTGLMNFYDLQVNRVYVNSSISRLFDKDYSFSGTRTTYDYNTADQGGGQYGNLTRVVESAWDGSQWVDYRATKTVFVPNSSAHLTRLPARTLTLDCASGCDFTNETGKTTESLALYDNASTFSTAPSVGKLTAARTWVTGSSYSQVTNGYDAYGNQSAVTTYTGYGTVSSAPTVGASSTTTTYDTTYNTYPISQTNELSQTTQTAYNYIIGLPVSITDANNVTTSAQYDVFGRMVKVVAPGDSDSSPTLGITYYDTSIPFQVDLNQKVDNSGASIRLSRFYNGLGMQIQTQSVGALVNGVQKNVVVDSQFDSLGRKNKETVPYMIDYDAFPTFQAQTFTQALTQTTYDLVSRPLAVTEPNANVSAYAYNGLSSSVTDPAQNVTTTLKDVWGRVTSVDAATDADLAYYYNTRDLLTSVEKGTVGSHLTTSLTYDQAGRKISMDDPDMGDWTYTYNALGSLISQTDARTCVTSLDYDALNRLTGKTFSGSCSATPSISYTFDVGAYGKGHRSGMTDGSGSTAWTFDARGRTLSEVKTISGNPFITSWTYNSADQPVTMTYPDGEVLNYDYNSQGALNALTNDQSFTYLASTKYDEAGRMTQMNLGSSNLLQKNFSYYAWSSSVNGGRLNNMTVTNSSSATLQNLGYSYDSRGNITQINDPVNSETSTFSYDSLSRLTAMTVTNGGTTVHSETFGYSNTTGNLASKTGLNYTYDSVHPHAVASLSNGNSYTYDLNGNQTGRVIGTNELALTYDAANQLVQVQSDQPFASETLNWQPLTTPTVTPVYTHTPTATQTQTQTNTPTSTTTPETAQVIGQCGLYTTASASVDIPTGTSLLIVVEGGSNHDLPTAYTVGGQALTLVVNGNVITRNVRIYSRNLPPTGTQTINLTGFTTSPNGGAWSCYFLSGTDTSNPIRSSSYQSASSQTSYSIARVSEINDIVIDVLGLRFTTTNLGYNCGQTAGQISLTSKMATGYMTASGTSTNSCYTFSSNDITLASVAIKSASQTTATPTQTQTNTPTATPVYTHTPMATPTHTYTPSSTSIPGTTAQVIGQCGLYTTASASVDIPTETSLLIVVEGGSNHTLPSAYTVGGQALTLDVDGDEYDRKLRIYSKNQPPTGTQTINLTGFSTSPNGAAWSCYFLSGTDLTSPIRSSGYRSGNGKTSYSKYLTTEADDIVIDVLGLKNTSTSLSYDCGQTAGQISMTNKMASGYQIAIGTLTYACYVFSSNDIILGAVAIKPAPQPTATPTGTATATNANTATPNNSPTPSHTPTFTPTPSATYQQSATPSATPQDTSTPEATSSATPTETSTATTTATPTATGTPQNGEVTYTYDGDGNMVKSVIGEVTTYYVGSYYEKKVRGSEQNERKTYFAGTTRIAVRENGTLTWLIADHLGSTSVTVDASGTLLSSLKYTAFGELRSGTAATDQLYTGQRQEAEIGLYFYVSRFYDPSLGRFVSPDSIVPGAGDPQAYDRYAYANNNPIIFIDPTGHIACRDGEQCFRPVKIVAVVSLPNANVGSQFDYPVTDGKSNGQCGSFCIGSALLGVDPSQGTIEGLLQRWHEAGLSTNWLTINGLSAIAKEIGWDFFYKYLGERKDKTLLYLFSKMSEGYYPILYAWSDSSGNLLTDTKQTMMLKDNTNRNTSYVGGTRHFILMTKITINLITNQTTVTIFNPGTGKNKNYGWDFLYDNMGIIYEQAIFENEKYSYSETHSSWLSGFIHP